MKIRLLILICALTTNITAQTIKETKTFFGKGKPKIGYFVSPSCELGKIAGSTAVLPGLGAGVILNNKLSIEITCQFIITENTPAGETDDRLYLDQFYAGVKGEYSIFPTKIVHFNFQLEAGIGHTELDLKDSFENQHENAPTIDASFAYLEPGIALEINLLKYMRLDVGAGYRFISNVSFRNLSEKDFVGFNYSAGLKLGLF